MKNIDIDLFHLWYILEVIRSDHLIPNMSRWTRRSGGLSNIMSGAVRNHFVLKEEYRYARKL